MASAPEETYDRSLGLCRRAVAARGGLRRSLKTHGAYRRGVVH